MLKMTLKISQNITGDANDENNFSQKLFLTNKQVLDLHNSFESNCSAITRLSKKCIKQFNQADFLRTLDH